MTRRDEANLVVGTTLLVLTLFIAAALILVANFSD